MNDLEDLVRDTLQAHGHQAPSGMGMAQAARGRAGRMRRNATIGWTLTSVCLLVLAIGGSALARRHNPDRSGVATTVSGATCPPLDGGRAVAYKVDKLFPGDPWVDVPAGDTAAKALARALGEQARGPFADIFASLAIDKTNARVILCVFDPARGQAMVKAAKQASPGIDLSRLDMYRSAYSQRILRAAGDTLLKEHAHDLGYPIDAYSVAPNASGLEVFTSPEGAQSAAFHDRVLAATGGIPVTLTGEAPGGADVPLSPKG